MVSARAIEVFTRCHGYTRKEAMKNSGGNEREREADEPVWKEFY